MTAPAPPAPAPAPAGWLLDRRLLRRALAARALPATVAAMAALGGALAVAQAWALSRAVDRAFLGRAGLADLGFELALLVAAVCGRALAVLLGEAAAGALAGRVKRDLRAGLIERLIALGPSFTRSRRTGALAAAAVEGVEGLDAYLRQYLPGWAAALLVPPIVLAAVAPLDPLSGLVLLLTAPLIPLFMVLIGRAAEARTRRQYGRLSRLSAQALDLLQGLATLKLLGRSRDRARALARASEAYRQATLGSLRVAFLSAFALELVATLSTAVVAVQVGLRLLYGHIAFGPALFVLVLAPEFYLPLRSLGARFHAGAAGAAAFAHIARVLEQPGPLQAPRRAGAPALREGLSLRDLHYTYPGGRAALRGVSFEIERGRTLALVGPGGAGKSTLVALLLRFLEPGRGRILLDGRPLDEWSAEAWRGAVAWVPQSPHLIHASLGDNLRLARPHASPSELARALRAAALEDFVAALPRGLDTAIGERGQRLSGGQAQRLALARAFLKDAPFLILDEPTSQVDPDLEHTLQASTAALLDGRTALVIAHRLNTVYRADRIVVLDQGRLAESGAHADLWRAGGLYARLLSAYAGEAG